MISLYQLNAIFTRFEKETCHSVNSIGLPKQMYKEVLNLPLIENGKLWGAEVKKIVDDDPYWCEIIVVKGGNITANYHIFDFPEGKTETQAKREMDIVCAEINKRLKNCFDKENKNG